MKNVFRVQGGGYCGIPHEETTNCLEIIPAPPPVVFTVQQAEERERRLKANQQPWKREFYDPLPCILAIKEQEHGA